MGEEDIKGMSKLFHSQKKKTKKLGSLEEKVWIVSGTERTKLIGRKIKRGLEVE